MPEPVPAHRCRDGSPGIGVDSAGELGRTWPRCQRDNLDGFQLFLRSLLNAAIGAGPVDSLPWELLGIGTATQG
jgi:hypothetical protein